MTGWRQMHHSDQTPEGRQTPGQTLETTLGTTEKSEKFFRRLLSIWENAAADSEEVEKNLLLCEGHLRLRFATRPLARLISRAFQHCRPPVTPDHNPFTIYVFAGREKEFFAQLPWEKKDFAAPRGELRSGFEPDLLAASYLMEIVYICSPKRKEALYWFRHEHYIPYFEQAAPCRPILHWWLRDNGWLMVHGAGIGDGGKSILLMGKSGSGKSTLSVAAANSGFQFLGEDYCAVRNDPFPRLATIFSTVKLTPESCRLLKLEPSETILEITGKHLFFLSDKLIREIPDGLPLAALVLPETRPQEMAGVQPLTSAQNAIQLSVSSLYQLPHSGGAEFRKLAQLARELPGWKVIIPTGRPERAMPALKEILASAPSTPRT